MPQELILNKIAAFLKLKAQQTPTISNLIEDLPKGCCHGFTIGYGMMDWLDRFYDKKDRRNKARWLAMLAHIENWREGDDPDQIECELPMLRSSQSDQKDSKNASTEKVTLTSIFEKMIDFIVDNQVIFNNQTNSLLVEKLGPLTSQRQFLEPLKKQSDKKSDQQTDTRRLEVAIIEKSAGFIQPHPTIDVLTIQDQCAVGSFDEKNKEDLKLLIACLEHPDTKILLASGICKVVCKNHACFLGFDLDTNQWSFYDPNYKNNTAKQFDNPRELAKEMYKQLFHMRIGFNLIHLTPPPSGLIFFKPYWERLQDSKRVHSHLDNGGFIDMVDFAPKAMPVALQHPSVKAPTFINQQNANGDTALIRAAESVNVDLVQLLLDNKADPTIKNNEGETALISSIHQFNGKLKTTELILKAKPSLINEPDTKGHTPLHHAIFLNQLDLVKMLLENKADGGIKNKKGLISLHLIIEKNIEITQCLLQTQPHLVNEKDPEGNTALHNAVGTGPLELVNLLLEYKADGRIKNDKGQTALHKAILANNIETTKLLLQNQPLLINEQDLNGNTALHYAAHLGSPELVKILLEYGGDNGKQNNLGQTPLLLSIHANNIKITKVLLEKKPNYIDKIDQDGFTILHYAIQLNKYELIELLFEYKASCSIKTKAGNTPLHLSVKERNLEATKLLLEKQSHLVNEQNQGGYTPLHFAALYGTTQLIELLLEVKVENKKSIQGQTTLHLAVRTKNREITELLLRRLKALVDEQDKDGYTALHHAVYLNQYKLVEILLKNNANISIRNKFDQTPLDIAISQGHVEVVKFLLGNKADNKTKNKLGRNALHLSILAKNREITELLLKEHQYPVNEQDQEGYTPLHHAAINGPIELLLDLLFEFNADPSIKDKQNRTAEQLITITNDPHIKKILIIPRGSRITREQFTILYQLGRRNFSGLDLSHLNLRKTSLENIQFDEKTILFQTKFKREQIIQLRQSENTNFQSVDLVKADLSGLNLSRCDLRKADLTGADLTDTNLEYAQLNSVKLHGAKLGRNQFEQFCRARIIDFNQVDLRGADLRGFDLRHCSFKRANFIGVHFSLDNLPKIGFFTSEKFGAVLYDEKTSPAAKNAIKTLISYLKDAENKPYDTEKMTTFLIDLIRTQRMSVAVELFLKFEKAPVINKLVTESLFRPRTRSCSPRRRPCSSDSLLHPASSSFAAQ